MARKDPKLELLARVPLFAGCGRPSLDEIARLADEVDLPAGYAIIRQGTIGDQFVLIIDGRVRIERNGRLIRTMGPGDFLGEISLVDGGPTMATATTEGPARVFVLSRQGFNSLLDQSPSIRTSVLYALARRIRQLEPEAFN